LVLIITLNVELREKPATATGNVGTSQYVLQYKANSSNWQCWNISVCKSTQSEQQQLAMLEHLSMYLNTASSSNWQCWNISVCTSTPPTAATGNVGTSQYVRQHRQQ
jgi:hypothetical protein